jgi:hypothetical protein
MRFLLLLPLAAVLGSCSTSNDEPAGQEVSRSDYGKNWPLTVESGRLACEGSNGIGEATITVDATSYALNGLAKQNPDNADIRPIWADDPELGSGLKKDIGFLIDDALKLCD